MPCMADYACHFRYISIKDVSIILWLVPGQLGATPAPHAVAYSPLYDLVNTRVHLPGDRFAFPINGKNDMLKIKDLAAVAARWGRAKSDVVNIATELAQRIQK